MKFYYDFQYLLGAVYYQDVQMELLVTPGWYFTAVYGNLYRIKEYIMFKFCHLEPSKKICVCLLPTDNSYIPYCNIQIITNYVYNRQHFITINNIVCPLTNSLQTLYSCQDYNISASTISKTYLSSLRLEDVNNAKNKLIKNIAIIWKNANHFYKKVQN